MDSNLKSSKNSRKKWIIIAIILAVLLIAISFLYNWQRYFTKDYESTQNDSYATPAIVIENFDYLKKITFKVKEYDEIPDEYKKGIVQIFINNKFYDLENNSEKFHLTNIKDRAKKVFAFGNFTGETEENKPDIAFLVESEDSNASILFVISSKGNLLFKKRYESEPPLINSFKKGSNIFMDSSQLQPSPEDGLIINFKYDKNSIVYDKKSKSFEEFHQYSTEELNDMKNSDVHEEPSEEIISDSTR